MFFDPRQYVVSMCVVLLAAAIAIAMVLGRGRGAPLLRRWCGRLLGVCAILALVAWARFGELHFLSIDAPGVNPDSPDRAKVERRLPFHFHEFFHYYLGSKYFRQLGYLGLYDCTALADLEIASEAGASPRIRIPTIRDLDDVLRDKPYPQAIAHCRDDLKPRFSAERWESFKNDLRALATIVSDGMWDGVVFDAGFNPPPSWVVLGGLVSNAIPIRFAGVPGYLLATSIDMALLVAVFVLMRRAFGAAPAAMAAVFFGASFIASYGWNGGAFLRYTWIAAVVFALVAMRRGRWALAGAMFALGACDRLFPLAFAIGAAIPLARGAIKNKDDRERLLRMGKGFGAVAAALVLLSVVVYGASSWRVFFDRIVRHGDVYYVMHIGLKKVVTWRPWVQFQNFHGHFGLMRFHDWNVRLHETWAASRAVAIPIQLAALGGATYAALRRRPWESAVLFGLVVMFFFNLPANYYFVALVLAPAIFLRAAVTAPTRNKRWLELGALVAFVAFWICTLVSSRIWEDAIVYDHFICVALMAFFAAWILAWSVANRRAFSKL